MIKGTGEGIIVTPPDYDKRQPGPASADGYTSSTPGIDPAYPYTLPGPHYRGELPSWGGPDYRDPALIAGRPRSSYLYVMVLLLAAGADIGAFFQIVELVLAQDPLILVYVVALGFTATALSLAHKGGALSRDHMAGAAWAGTVMPCLCVTAWLLLGIAAFYVRLTLLGSSFSGSLSLSVGPSQTGPSSPPAFQAAIVFLALYLATGLVAWMGAYLSRNPLLESYKLASRAFLEARSRADVSSSQADSAEVILSVMRAELAAAEKTLEYEIHSRLALAEELKLVTHATRAPETAA